jgi:A/G-specific adenine glycosylase
MSSISVKKFRGEIWRFYRKNKRDFPWRNTEDPYKILVSEIMLQQTQTDRVMKKYKEWLKLFPTFSALAQAPLRNVLRTWQGLGYNRRGLNLKRTAEIISKDYKNIFPKSYEEIIKLPGIGLYTAGALMAFAYNKPIPIIETNIRTVYLHFFFRNKTNIHDQELLEIIEKTLDRKNVREWYYALMDYGVMLKKTVGNLNKNSRHYAKQSPFMGSHRQIRAAVLDSITNNTITPAEIKKRLIQRNIKANKTYIVKVLQELEKDGFIIVRNSQAVIA